MGAYGSAAEPNPRNVLAGLAASRTLPEAALFFTMRHHLGLLTLLLLLAVAFGLAWFVIDDSRPGYRAPVRCECHCTQADDESADDDASELL